MESLNSKSSVKVIMWIPMLVIVKLSAEMGAGMT